MANHMKYPCPCCGYLVFGEKPGSYDCCPICYWDDDVVSLALPTVAIGPNSVSLIEAQRNFREFGASERRFVGSVRQPYRDEEKDASWYPITEEITHKFPNPDESFEYPEDDMRLYYWKKDYFRKTPK